MMAWLKHHFIEPDVKRKAKGHLIEVEMALFGAHASAEKAKHEVNRLEEARDRLKAVIENESGVTTVRSPHVVTPLVMDAEARERFLRG
jgi:hypothetical protein